MPLRDTVCRCMHISSKSFENFSIQDYFIVADKVFFQCFKQNLAKWKLIDGPSLIFQKLKTQVSFPGWRET